MKAWNLRWWMLAGGAIPALLLAGIVGGGCYGDSRWYSCDDNDPPRIDNKPCYDAGPDVAVCDEDAGSCNEAGAGAGGGGTGGGEQRAPDDDIGGDTSSSCAGQCVPKEPSGWFEPLLLWLGPPDRAPDCPASAPVAGHEPYYADLVVEPHRCAACACDPPEASCELPGAWSAVDSPTCPAGPEAQRTSFAAPEAWDGTCTTANAIPAGQACAGGPCAQSLDLPAPRVRAGACTARVVEAPGEPQGGFRWATLAKTCAGTTDLSSCGESGGRCAPAPPVGDAAPPEGFLTCLMSNAGEHTCPPAYPSRHIAYRGADDTRGCAACTCGDPSGGSCSVLASAFSDETCSTVVVSVLTTSEAPFCGAIAPGTALGSKSAAVVDLDPGSCTPGGGEPIGEVTPREAVTFCCLDRQPELPPEPPRFWNPEFG